MSTIAISLPDETVAEARRRAEQHNVSFEEYVAKAVAWQNESARQLDYLRERAKGANKEAFLAALRAAPDVPPMPGDEIE